MGVLLKEKLQKIFFPDSIVISVNRTSMASHRPAVSHVIVTTAVQKDSNAIKMASVRVTTMLRDVVAIDAKRINTIGIKVASTARTVTI